MNEKLVVASLTPTPTVYDYAADSADALRKTVSANQTERDGRNWSMMTEAAYLAAHRQHYLGQPLTEVAPAEFHQQLGMVPPLNQSGRNGVDSFIVGEATSGSIFRQYALLNGRAFWRYVDANDPATWITSKEIAAHCVNEAHPDERRGGAREATRRPGQGAGR